MPRIKQKEARMETKFLLPTNLVSIEVSPCCTLSMPNKSEHAASVLRMAAEKDALRASADIVFVCRGGATVQAHAAIVAVASSVVNKLVEEQGCHCKTLLKTWIASFRGSRKAIEAMDACSCFREQPELSIFVPDVTEECLKTLLDCIYSGGSSKTISPSLADNVAEAAHLFGVKGIEVVKPFSEATKKSVSVQDINGDRNEFARSRRAKTIVKANNGPLENSIAHCETPDQQLNGVRSAKEKRRFVLSSKAVSKRAKVASASSPEQMSTPESERETERTQCPTCHCDVTFLSRDDFVSHLIAFHHGDSLQSCLGTHDDCKECASSSERLDDRDQSAQIDLAALRHLAVDHGELKSRLTADEDAFLAKFHQRRLPDDSALLRDPSAVRCPKSQMSSLKPALEMAAQLAGNLGRRLEASEGESPVACPACETSVGRGELVQHLTKHLFGKILYVYGLSGRTGPCIICGDVMASTTNLVLHYAVDHRKVIDAAGVGAKLERSIFRTGANY